MFETPQTSNSVARDSRRLLFPPRPAQDPGLPRVALLFPQRRPPVLLAAITALRRFESRDPMTLRRGSRFPTHGAVGPWASGGGKSSAVGLLSSEMNAAAEGGGAGRRSREGRGRSDGVKPGPEHGRAACLSQPQPPHLYEGAG